MKFIIGNWSVSVEPIPPLEGAIYCHKDRDPYDIIDHVIPQTVDDGIVRYIVFYKDESLKPTQDKAAISEFNHWFRRG